MASFLRRNRSLLIAIVIILLLGGISVVGFRLWKGPSSSGLPGPGDPVYEEYVETFQIGLAAMDVEVGEVAEENLTRAVNLIPQEPAGWADRGLLFLRTNRLPDAGRDLAQASKLAPGNPAIEKLLGLWDERNGRFPEAAVHLRQAVEKDPDDVEAIYRLALIINKNQNPETDAEFQHLMEAILARRPENRRVLIDRLTVANRRSDLAAVNDTLARFRTIAPSWTRDITRSTFAELEREAAGQLGNSLIPAIVTFSNVLAGEPGYVRSAEEVNPLDTQAGQPLRSFVKLAPMRNSPAPPDTELTFSPEPLASVPAGRWDCVVPFWLTGEGKPVIFVANAHEVRPLGSGRPLPSLPLAVDGLIPFDWNNDTRTDLLLVGPSGLRFYQQGMDGNFMYVTAKTSLPAEILHGDYVCAIAVDVDLDGDIDLLLAPRNGQPIFLQNNFDGTFKSQPIFPGVTAARAFAWADLDNDGAPDAIILDAGGHIHVFANERSGQFRNWPVAIPDGPYLAVAIADVDDDGVFDLVALRQDGAVVRISDQNKRSGWDVAELARWDSPATTEPGRVRLFVADLDNNGVPDLLASGPTGSKAWLGSGSGKFEALPAALPPRVSAVVDLDNTGRLDLLALDDDGHPVRFRSSGKMNYHWQNIHFRAAPGADRSGDNRINSFAIGGEMEIRTGTFVSKRQIDAPILHMGLGERSHADVMRIQWPNGAPQIEFKKPLDQAIVAEQRLKGSCPFLFTWNGERFVFVTDFMWSTPLGMYINAQDKGGLSQTTEWVKIRGNQLVPLNGYYEVRVNANLWETHYFDHLALHVIDHPAGTDMFVDERFALEPSTPSFHLMEASRPVARAWDHPGGDVTDIVRAIDGIYLDRAGRGLYQGVTNEHWVEVDLGDDAPKDGPVWLIAHGWIHPTDSSINYALEQSSHPKPHGLVLEVPDGKGGWKVIRDRIGFPAGKNKSVLIRLDGLDGPGVSRRFRLRTNMEIYWDALHYARGRNDAEVIKKELLPTAAELRFRGILAMSQANSSSPELPDYDHIVTFGHPWRDLIGFHTRFGDIRELLEKIDDRYAIVTAGDDIALRFAVPSDPPPGWQRDFVWVSDGWVKDGDLNTRFGKTVLPLPSHGMTRYDQPPGLLEDDPVFRRHRKDWELFHTRYVTPDIFSRGLRSMRTP